MPAKKSKSRRSPPSRLAMILDNFIRHKFKWIIGGCLTLGPAGMAAAYQWVDPYIPAFHYWVHTLVDTDHVYIIYLKLRDAQQSLKDANAELAKTPGSTTAQRAADYYTDIIKKYQRQLDRASGN